MFTLASHGRVPFLPDKFNRLFRAPRGLMQFSGHTVKTLGQFPQNMPFGSYPVCVVVSRFPVIAGCMGCTANSGIHRSRGVQYGGER